MTPQEMLQDMIDDAWKEYSLSLAEEEEKPDNHSVSLERSFAEGYAEALSVAHFLIFDEEYTAAGSNVN
jgi:hypothetical protein